VASAYKTGQALKRCIFTNQRTDIKHISVLIGQGKSRDYAAGFDFIHVFDVI